MNKRIAFLVYNFSNTGGLYQVVVNLINELCKEYDIHLISLIQDKPISYEIDPRIKYTYLFSKETRLRNMWKDARIPLKEYVKDNYIDTVILEGDYPGIIGSSLRFTTNAKIIFHEHGSLMSQWDRKDIVGIRFLSSFLSHKTVVLTNRNKEAYKKKFLKRDKNIFVVPNWVEEIGSASYQYNKNSKKVIYVGRFGVEKGVLRLLKSWKLIEKELPGWTLDLYGDGEEKEKIVNFIEDNNLNSSVKLKGWVNDVTKNFKDYAFLVLPSDREGFPLVLLEAQALGLPVISYDILTGPSEIINHNKDGFLVEEKNTEDFAKSILFLANHPEKREEFSKNAIENVEKFSKERILDIWREILG